MLVFPELTFTGYSFLCWDDAAKVAEKPDGLTAKRMVHIAKALKAYTVWGFVETDEDFLYNSASIADPSGNIILTVRKLNLWGNDFLWATPAEKPPDIIQTDLGWMSVVVCRDILDRNQSGGRLFSGRKIDIVAAPMNWGGAGFPSVDWIDFVKNNSCVLAVANKWGKEYNKSFVHDFGQGGSVIIGKDVKPHIEGLVFGADSVVAAMVEL
jgi:predicted amidohydrolase